MRQSLPVVVAILSLAAPVAAPASVGAEGDGGGDVAELHLVAMDEMRIPIVDADRADGALKVTLVLEATDAIAADALTKALPSLRAAALGGAIEFARLYASPMAPVNAERLAADLDLALRRQHPGIARVLIVEVAAETV